ncbi:MAG TPA: M20/M25/M40 family metallo-hydrolase [Telluria sp.]
MRLPSLNLFLGVVLGGLLMQSTRANADAPVTTPASRLIKEIAERAELMPNLEELCDGIGPRMTGSRQLRTAQAWAIARLKGYGAVDVHLQAYELGRPWRRGMARARLLNASGIALDVVQQAWTQGTGGVVTTDLAILDVKTLEEFKAVAPALKGKIVLLVSAPAATPEQQKNIKRYRADLKLAFKQAQFAAVLSVSGREGNLFDMWGGPGAPFDRAAAIITKDHARLLQRLLAKGSVPRLEIELAGGFGKHPVKAYNVVADLPGTDQSDEVVIVGAHLDSWDIASGATDNGAGVVVMMEVLRALHAAGMQPKRRLRVVLFSGEEQGLLGSKAYLAAHRAELANIQAVLVQDAGAGRITGFLDMKVDSWAAALSSATAPLAELGGVDVVYAAGRGSDYVPFFDAGIPAFPAMQDLRDYRSHTQHSQVDSVDHVNKDDLVQAA